MATMGRYCKAYMLSQFRQYSKWSERAENARPEEVDGSVENEKKPRQLTDDSIVYLQEDLSVTDGIYLNECVLFQDASMEWEQFCNAELAFAVPEYVKEAEKAVEEMVAASAAG